VSPLRRANGRYALTVLAAIVALALLGTAAVVALVVAGSDTSATPVIVTLLGFLGTTIVALLGLLKTERVESRVADVTKVAEETHDELNGRLETIEAAALRAAAASERRKEG
jgi:hypothetical protein